MAKVLILDQSKSIRNTLRERLEFEGIAAESAENEAAASVLCERIPFDLIISDHETRLPRATYLSSYFPLKRRSIRLSRHSGTERRTTSPNRST